jgi:hypothetical protein
MGHLFSIPSQKGRVTAAPTREPDRLVFSLHLTHPQKGKGKQARFLQGHQPCLVLRSRRWHRPASRLSSVPPPPAPPHKGEGSPGRSIRSGGARSPRFLKRTAGKLPRLALTCRVCAAGDREDREPQNHHLLPSPLWGGAGGGGIRSATPHLSPPAPVHLTPALPPSLRSRTRRNCAASARSAGPASPG